MWGEGGYGKAKIPVRYERWKAYFADWMRVWLVIAQPNAFLKTAAI